MHQNPLGVRKTMRLVVGLTILVWATQTLLHQWGYGAEIPVGFGNTTLDVRFDQAKTAGEIQPAEVDGRPEEKFVPGSARYLAGATLELRGEATIVGSEVKLRQVCRWAEADQAAFEPIADLVIMRVGGSVPFRGLSLDELKQTLSDAGVNMAVIHLAGSTTCTIQRNDVKVDEHVALEQWINARQAGSVATVSDAIDASPVSAAAATTLAVAGPPLTDRMLTPASTKPQPMPTEEQNQHHSLRELLAADLALRLSLPVDTLQIKFNASDEKLLALTEPIFKFNVDGRHARMLGDVSWEITLLGDDAKNKKTNISATARAYQNQIVVNHPMGYRQIIRDTDVVERHALVDHLSDQPLLTREQTVGQLSARELKAGTVMTAPLVEAVPLAKAGDLLHFMVAQGKVQILSVGIAQESGTFGQTIKVRSDTTKDIFMVTLTGPQRGRISGPATSEPGPLNDPKVVSLDRN